MSSVLDSEDQPMPNATTGDGDKNVKDPDEAFIDLNDQRIRVVRNEPSQSPNVIG